MKKYEQKLLELLPEDIELRDLPEEFIGSIGLLHATRIQVRGKAASMADVTVQSLVPYIDLSGITMPGSYRVHISLDNPGDLIVDSVLTAMVDVEYRGKLIAITTSSWHTFTSFSNISLVPDVMTIWTLSNI